MPGFARQKSKQSLPQEKLLERFMKEYLRDPDLPDATAHYSYAFVDLNDDGVKEAVVYVSGQSWCGSGGCRTIVLVQKGSSFREIAHITISRPPIKVFKAKTNGWHDLGVLVAGCGTMQGYEAELPFNGKRYASNPSVRPAKRAKSDAPSETLKLLP